MFSLSFVIAKYKERIEPVPFLYPPLASTYIPNDKKLAVLMLFNHRIFLIIIPHV
jgi:hypothetical protein